MITVIARWESTQMPEMVEWNMWRQLKGAFSIDRFIFIPRVHKLDSYTFEQADSVPEALAMTSQHKRIFLEPRGGIAVSEIATLGNGDAVFVLGNTQYSNEEYAKANEMYRIETPGKTHIYGINAAAIALAYWWGQ